jgi:hypothetical protein
MNKQSVLSWVQHRFELFDYDDNPFGCSDWVVHFLNQVAQDDWRFFADHASRLILYSTPEKPRQWMALRNYYTCLFSVVPPEVLPDADTIEIAPLDEAQADALMANMRTRGWYARKYFASGNRYLPCAGLSFADYLAARPSQVRNTLRRKGKSFPGTLEIITGGERLEIGIAAYEHVYLRSWKKPEPYANFVGDWMRICARNGWLRLGVAWLDDKPIAAQFWFVRKKRAFIYKLAYDEEHKPLSAGSLLTAELFRHCLDIDRVDEVDYLSGDDAYKSQWVTHRRERVGVKLCNLGTMRGKFEVAIEWGGETLKRLKQRRDVTPQTAIPVPEAD